MTLLIDQKSVASIKDRAKQVAANLTSGDGCDVGFSAIIIAVIEKLEQEKALKKIIQVQTLRYNQEPIDNGRSINDMANEEPIA